LFPPKLIICPTDFSEAAAGALVAARRFAERYSSEILLVHVVADVTPLEYDVNTPRTFQLGNYREALMDQAQKQMEELRTARFPAGAKIRATALVGDAAREITALAEAEEADLIVMATHGRSGFARLVLGSITEKVVRTAACPVMVIPIL
jgi:nucleotide-binding universal stress UspA family protein